MVKGGGAALTREKIVAAQSRRFVCIADESKLVQTLGAFPLPVEVIPMATARLVRQFAALGGQARVRLKDGQPLVTDNGQHILDVTGLRISDPLAFESEVNQWQGVVTVGVFAHQKAADVAPVVAIAIHVVADSDRVAAGARHAHAHGHRARACHAQVDPADQPQAALRECRVQRRPGRAERQRHLALPVRPQHPAGAVTGL